MDDAIRHRGDAYAIRAKLPMVTMTELFHIPLCITGLLVISKSSKLASIITYLGKHSTTLWFVHGYFCWTFLTNITYSIKLWPLSFGFMVLVCLGIGALMDEILERIRFK